MPSLNAANLNKGADKRDRQLLFLVKACETQPVRIFAGQFAMASKGGTAASQ
jgi:hypothetical protein